MKLAVYFRRFLNLAQEKVKNNSGANLEEFLHQFNPFRIKVVWDSVVGSILQYYQSVFNISPCTGPVQAVPLVLKLEINIGLFNNYIVEKKGWGSSQIM